MRGMLLLATLLLAVPAWATTNQPGEVEVVGGVPFTHRFAVTGATSWHYVEGGNPDGEVVVFFAGLPESWFSFHHQMVDLAPSHRVVGIDLFGQTVRPASESFDRIAIARDLTAFLDAIGVARANWVSHDWGTVISDALVGLHSDRILRYARLEAPLHITDPALTPQATLFQNLGFTQRFFGNPENVVNTLYGDAGLAPAVTARLVEELSHTDQVALVAHRLFLDNFPGATEEAGAAFKNENVAYAGAADVPVLLVQANEDPRQPLYFFDGSAGDPTAASLYERAPFVALTIIEDSGHFSELEEPAQVNAALRTLLQHPAATTGPKPWILSAYQGLDENDPLDNPLLPLACPDVVPGVPYGGIPVVFAEEIVGGHRGQPNAVDPAAFAVTLRTARGTTPAPVVCALLAPASGSSENRTVALIGEFGPGVSPRGKVRSLTVEVVGDLFTETGVNLHPLALGTPVAFEVTAPFEAGPPLVYAELARLPDPAQEHTCPAGTDWIVRLVFAGGVTQVAGRGPACSRAQGRSAKCYLDSFGCRLTDADAQNYVRHGAPPGLRACTCEGGPRDGCGVIRLRDQTGGRLQPFAIGDLFDGDNDLELCLRDADMPTGFAIPSTVRPQPGRFFDPHRDRNRRQRWLRIVGAGG